MNHEQVMGTLDLDTQLGFAPIVSIQQANLVTQLPNQRILKENRLYEYV